MPLIQCYECKRDISDAANACPQCGAPVSGSMKDREGVTTTSAGSKGRNKAFGHFVPALLLVLVTLVGTGGVFAYQEAIQAAAEEEARALQRAAEQAEASKKEQARAMQQAAEQAEVKRKEQERAGVLENPGQFLKISDVQIHDEGILTAYRQLSGFTLTNRSPLPLHEIKGTVEWINESGESTGSTPFSIRGALPAGDMKTFSTRDGTLKSGTLQSAATRTRIAFEHVAIVE
jgi:hypothetical protein